MPQRLLTFRALHDAVLLHGGMGVKIVRKTPQRLLTFRALHDTVLLHGGMGFKIVRKMPQRLLTFRDAAVLVHGGMGVLFNHRADCHNQRLGFLACHLESPIVTSIHWWSYKPFFSNSF